MKEIISRTTESEYMTAVDEILKRQKCSFQLAQLRLGPLEEGYEWVSKDRCNG